MMKRRNMSATIAAPCPACSACPAAACSMPACSMPGCSLGPIRVWPACAGLASATADEARTVASLWLSACFMVHYLLPFQV